jgi:hypothetical protein
LDWQEGWHWQKPFSHSQPAGHVPHIPPHPLSPQVKPVQSGMQTHSPSMVQTLLSGQIPHWPPQPSGPQAFPTQLGRQRHWASMVQTWLGGHAPQDPPQPSGPHCFPAQSGEHVQASPWPSLSESA